MVSSNKCTRYRKSNEHDEIYIIFPEEYTIYTPEPGITWCRIVIDGRDIQGHDVDRSIFITNINNAINFARKPKIQSSLSQQQRLLAFYQMRELYRRYNRYRTIPNLSPYDIETANETMGKLFQVLGKYAEGALVPLANDSGEIIIKSHLYRLISNDKLVLRFRVSRTDGTMNDKWFHSESNIDLGLVGSYAGLEEQLDEYNIHRIKSNIKSERLNTERLKNGVLENIVKALNDGIGLYYYEGSGWSATKPTVPANNLTGGANNLINDYDFKKRVFGDTTMKQLKKMGIKRETTGLWVYKKRMKNKIRSFFGNNVYSRNDVNTLWKIYSGK